MAEKKVARKSRANTSRSAEIVSKDETSQGGLFDFFRFGESYTSLILGIVVVIIAAVLLVSFVKNRNFEQLTRPNPEISSIATSQSSKTFPKSYTVQPGDDLWKIAEKTYNDGYQWVAIAKANNITNPSQITAGQKIQLPKIDDTSKIAMTLTNTPMPTKAEPTVQVAKPTITLTPTTQVKAQLTPTKSVNMNANTTKGGVEMTEPSKNTISGSSYTVVHGDNLWNIAVRAYGDGFQWHKIADANHLANPRVIHSGNVLTLPR